MKQRISKENKLEKGLEKPEITLKPLEKTAVHTSTQEEYNTLMRIYECGGWKAFQFLGFKLIAKEDCIEAKNEFLCDSKRSYQEIEYKVISTKKFYNIQNIIPKKIAEINSYFETTSPVNA